MKPPKLSPAQALILHNHPREALQHLGSSPADRFLEVICYRHLGELYQAQSLLHSLVMDPDPSLPVQAMWNTYGMIKTDLGHFEESVTCFENALDLLNSLPNAQNCSYDGNTGRPQIMLNLAYALMRLGRFEKAWPLWESSRYGWSWETPLVPWTGEPGRVIVVPEGGIGDQILFSRWIPTMEKMGAEVTYYVHEELIGILPHTIKRVIPRPRSVNEAKDAYPGIDWAKYDYATSIMSLPAICGVRSIADIPPDFWGWPKERTRKAGLCWAAEEIGVQRKTRSIPIEELEPLRGLAEWISLAPGRVHPDWIESFKPRSWIHTFELLRSLDFLVTCDTAVAHLAGSLGLSTYLILPLSSDWKYFTHELVASPWYASVELIRNTHAVSFAPAIQSLVEKLP